MNSKQKEQLRQRANTIIQSPKYESIEREKFNSLEQVIEELDIYNAELEAQSHELQKANEELEKSQKIFKVLFDQAPIVYLMLDKDYTILKINQKGMKKFSLTYRNNKLNFASLIAKGGIEKFYNWMNQPEEESLQIQLAGICGVFWGKITKELFQYDGNNQHLISIVDITQEITAQEDLNSKISNIEKTLQEKDKLAQMGNMLSSILHQWKQPLNTISLVCGKYFITQGKDTTIYEVKNEDVHKVRAQVEYMNKTADDFRSYLNTKNLKKSFFLFDIFEKIQKLTGVRLQINTINFSLTSKENIEIFGFESEFLQVMLNLVNNSIDQLESQELEDKKIELSYTKKDKDVEIYLKDNGGGIAQELLPDMIFHSNSTTKKDGEGIGLYLCKKIITEHFNGTLLGYNELNSAVFKITIKKENKNES